jgi:hypothetical protein
MRATGVILNSLGILIGVWAAFEFAILAIRTAWWMFVFAAACAWAFAAGNAARCIFVRGWRDRGDLHRRSVAPLHWLAAAAVRGGR